MNLKQKAKNFIKVRAKTMGANIRDPKKFMPGGGGLVRQGVRAAARAAAPVARKVAVKARNTMSLGKQELMRSETSMRKRWDKAGPAARRYLGKGLKQIQGEIRKHR